MTIYEKAYYSMAKCLTDAEIHIEDDDLPPVDNNDASYFSVLIETVVDWLNEYKVIDAQIDEDAMYSIYKAMRKGSNW